MGVRTVSFTKGRKFKINKVRCRNCGKMIESIDPDKTVYCRCGLVWISGGRERALRGGVVSFAEEHSVYA